MVYLYTELYIPNVNVSLIITIKPSAKSRFSVESMFLYCVLKNVGIHWS
jgi:hypothetical protein